jgi:hypothetical protein
MCASAGEGNNTSVITTGDSAWGSVGRRQVPVPGSLSELRGALDGVVTMPGRLFWLSPDVRRVQWDLSDRCRRRDFYEIVLVKGTVDDVCEFVNGSELMQLWDEMYLPPWIREAWRPLVEPGDVAA